MTEGEVPKSITTLAIVSLLLGLLILPFIALIGVILGIYILAKYPQKKGYGITVFLLNLIVLILGLWRFGFLLF
jgi:hypothetical protein